MLIIDNNDEANNYLDWEPNENVIAYMPFTNDLINKITNAWPTSNRNSSISNGVCYFNGGALYYNTSENINPNSWTVFQWLNPSERRSYSQRVGMFHDLREQWVLRNDSGNQPRFWQGEGSSSWDANNARPMPLNEWHCRVTTWDGSTMKVYKDGVPMVYPYTPNIVNNSKAFRIAVNNNYDYYKGYGAYIWGANGAWTQDEVNKFYKTTKKRLGIN